MFQHCTSGDTAPLSGFGLCLFDKETTPIDFHVLAELAGHSTYLSFFTHPSAVFLKVLHHVECGGKVNRNVKEKKRIDELFCPFHSCTLSPLRYAWISCVFLYTADVDLYMLTYIFTLLTCLFTLLTYRFTLLTYFFTLLTYPFALFTLPTYRFTVLTYRFTLMA